MNTQQQPDDNFYYPEQIKLPSYNYQSLLKALAITIIIMLSTTAWLLWFTWLAVQLQQLFNL